MHLYRTRSNLINTTKHEIGVMCEVAIGLTSNGLVLSHGRCLYQTCVLFLFWLKNRPGAQVWFNHDTLLYTAEKIC